ncbi:hypothetical protein IGI04_002116, partial [Brassica rapa subsp. trilocularis]
MEHVPFNTITIKKESFRPSTLGVVYAAAQLSRPVVPRLQRSINRLRACVTEHIFGGVPCLQRVRIKLYLFGVLCPGPWTSGETDEYIIFGWIGATGLYFGFLFGLRVSGVVYMGYYAMRYCWWHAVLQIGGDGCHSLIFLKEEPGVVSRAGPEILEACNNALPRTGSGSKLRSMGVLIPLEQSSLEKEAKDNT